MRDEARLGAGAMLVALLVVGGCAEDAGDDDDLAGDTAAVAPAPVGPRALFSAPFTADSTGAQGAQISGNVDVFRGQLPGWTGVAGAPAQTSMGDSAAGAADTGAAAAQPGAAGDGFTLAVHLNGLGQGDHAWHIHSGACGTEAPVVVPFTETPDGPGIDEPITVAQAGGMAMDTAFVPSSRLTLDALQASPHSLHVHASGGLDHGPTVACADLRSGGAPAASGATDSAR